MDFYEVLKRRSSTRAFTDEGVDETAVSRLLEAACTAPSAGNLQRWRFYVVRDGAVKAALARAAHGQVFLRSAPVVVVVCAELGVYEVGYGSRGRDLYAIQDTAAAAENILLSSVAEGLGSCWVGAFDEEGAAVALALPPGLRPLAMLAVGHPVARGPAAPKERFDRYTTYV